MDWTLKFTDIVIIMATFLGPIFAVQTQKYLERKHEKQSRQIHIFKTLMSTRASIGSQSHVDAINAIPIEFFGNDNKSKIIVEKWKEYFDHLSSSHISQEIWISRRKEIFTDLLYMISSHLGYKFSKAEIGREIYQPISFEENEKENRIIKLKIMDILNGNSSIPVSLNDQK